MSEKIDFKDFDILGIVQFLHSSGKEYIEYLNSNSYRVKDHSDTERLQILFQEK